MSIGINKVFLVGNLRKSIFSCEKERYPYNNPKTRSMKYIKNNISISCSFRRKNTVNFLQGGIMNV